MMRTLAAQPARRTPTLPPVDSATRSSIRIAVVDDERTLRESCHSVLQAEGYNVALCGRGNEARETLKRRPFDIALVDWFMGAVPGSELLHTALTTNPGTIVIIMTGNPSVASSLEALQAGAWDYLPKPFSGTQLQILIGRAAHAVLVARESRVLEEQRAQHPGDGDRIAVLGDSPLFKKAIALARKVAATDASVFLTGESGAGKELFAQFIHDNSRRSSRSLVAVNCAALPEPLLESEMFGHCKGAFTGAVRDKPGLLETANGGTLFLDELIEMPKSIQAKLLRVIQDGVVRRVGSETTDAVVNVRFIAATNGDPEAALRSGDLREDLYYRLRVVPIQVPPLRERLEDIPLLAEHFLTTFWSRHRRKGEAMPHLTEEALALLCTHPWRGNVRELQNVIEHTAVLVEPGGAIRPEDIPLTGEARTAVSANPASLVATLREGSYHAARERVIKQFEKQYLTWLVSRAGGNMSQAARVAGVDRTTLYRMMERHGLQRNPGAAWLVEREAEAPPVEVQAALPPEGAA